MTQGAHEHGGGTRGGRLLEISNAIVRLHKRYYGRGPSRARSHLSGDTLVVILRGGYTPGEKVLQERGHTETVINTRLAMQATIEDEMRGAVEGLLGRKVVSFMSANDPEHEAQAEIFLLEPGPDEHPEAGDVHERLEAAREESKELLESLRALRAEQVQARQALRRRGRDEPAS